MIFVFKCLRRLHERGLGSNRHLNQLFLDQSFEHLLHYRMRFLRKFGLGWIDWLVWNWSICFQSRGGFGPADNGRFLGILRLIRSFFQNFTCSSGQFVDVSLRHHLRDVLGSRSPLGWSLGLHRSQIWSCLLSCLEYFLRSFKIVDVDFNRLGLVRLCRKFNWGAFLLFSIYIRLLHVGIMLYFNCFYIREWLATSVLWEFDLFLWFFYHCICWNDLFFRNKLTLTLSWKLRGCIAYNQLFLKLRLW